MRAVNLACSRDIALSAMIESLIVAEADRAKIPKVSRQKALEAISQRHGVTFLRTGIPLDDDAGEDSCTDT